MRLGFLSCEQTKCTELVWTLPGSEPLDSFHTLCGKQVSTKSTLANHSEQQATQEISRACARLEMLTAYVRSCYFTLVYWVFSEWGGSNRSGSTTPPMYTDPFSHAANSSPSVCPAYNRGFLSANRAGLRECGRPYGGLGLDEAT